MSVEFNVDPALLDPFLDESSEMLGELDTAFIDLESSPDNKDIINTIFRPVHSLKGNAAFFGMNATKNLAHELETILDKARNDQLVISRSTIDILLEGVDALKQIVAQMQARESEIDDQSTYDALLERVVQAQAEDSFDIHSAMHDLLGAIASEAGIHEDSPIHAMVEAIRSHSLDDSRAQDQQQGASLSSDQLNKIRGILADAGEQKKSDDDGRVVVACLESMRASVPVEAQSIIDEMLDDCRTCLDSAVGFDPILQTMLADKLALLEPLLAGEAESPDPTSAPSGVPSEGAQSPSQSKAPSSSAAARTIRVSEDALDRFMSCVGELITAAESFSLAERRLRDADTDPGVLRDLGAAIRSFEELSDELQETVVGLRRVPLRGALQKIPRLAREVGAQLGKDVRVEIVGDDLLVDKVLVEALEAPLTHIIRNSMDHGLETNEDRVAAGKDAQGTLRVVARQEDDTVVLTIEDDGKGIDVDRIREKAVESDKVTRAEADRMSDHEALQLIFMSGLSTAKQISDVSGRGVGMDVVRTNIEKLNGSIELASEAGKGTCVTFRVPICAAVVVMQGISVRTGGHHFLLPTEQVHTMLQPEDTRLLSVQGQGEMLTWNDELFPVIRLSEALSVRGTRASGDRAPTVVVDYQGTRVALLVDDIVGMQRFLLKKLDGEYGRISSIAGGALMADGGIALVLNLSHLGETSQGQPMVA
ncbi:MAG: chemotaxis protein CheA [Planctomycetota bacterium]|jgi:two-component system chemotaxis sensor kinase CheA